MKLSVKNSLVNRRKVCSFSQDSLEEICPLLPTFDFFRAHFSTELFPEAHYFANTAYFYCDLGFPRLWKVTDEVYIEIEDEIADSCSSFYEWASRLDTSQDSEVEATAIFLNKHCVGLYVAEHNILYASDWVHTNLSIKIAEHFIKELYKKKVFKRKVAPLPEKSIKLERFDITLGCDPEFEVVDKGNIISASELPINSEARIGVDGAGDQLELRPRYKKKPEELVEEVKILLEEFGMRYKMELSVKGDYYPLGGHIHFGGKPPLVQTTAFIGLLDEWLGKPLIGLSGNARGYYKELGRYELKDWGFEYRSLPAAVFQSPTVTTAVLKICKVLAEEYYNGEGVEEKPTKEEVKRLGLEEEMALLWEFKKSYPLNNNTTIYRFWGIKVPNLRVHFRDEWSRKAKDLVLQKLEQSGLYDEKVTVVFFGFRQDRGKVISGFEAPGYTTMDMSEFGSRYSSNFRASWYCFGLPSDVRTQNLKALNYLIEKCIEFVKEVRKNEERTYGEVN